MDTDKNYEQSGREGSQEGVGELLQRNSLAIAGAICLLLVDMYPPAPGSFAAHWVILPAVMLAGFLGDRQLRQAALRRFETLPHHWRVGAASSLLLVAIYFVVAISLIPAPQPPPQEGQQRIDAAAPAKLDFMPTEYIERRTVAVPKQPKVRGPNVRHALAEKKHIIEDERAPQMSRPAPPKISTPSHLRIVLGDPPK